jgi:hypothetical protein
MVTKSNGYQVDGYIPDGQTSRGTESVDSANPKNASERRRNGVMADQGDSGQVQTTNTGTVTTRQTNYGGNTFARGTDASVPDPSVVNSNYAPNAMDLPTPTNVSAYRSYDVDPVELPSPNGDMRDYPAPPKLDSGQKSD